MRIDFKDMARVVGETWRTLTAREKAPYEADARKESAQYEQDRRKYEEKHKVWADLHHKSKASGDAPWFTNSMLNLGRHGPVGLQAEAMYSIRGQSQIDSVGSVSAPAVQAFRQLIRGWYGLLQLHLNDLVWTA